VPEAERQTLLVGYNRTRADYPGGATIHGLFEREAARAPEAPALRFEDSELSYRELDEQANRLARRLQSMGVGLETRVGLCVRRSPSLVIGLLAILKAGRPTCLSTRAILASASRSCSPTPRLASW
jgi:non-ribosomal peptide synthetase component F